ncbi:MAG: chemotaxis protein CheW [Oscillatoriaceae bacterium SKW80]|nr:chemotaxis protein CheW [Oscillatoriaceae bacterium SKYG93]MCX8121223.1 chemotaxis protein CheW [Oscillatoriaceae bacterium SKW80]MDW8453443.1 chemotaxis protein CheW [Oscillatoriaceae cyanobacterium SKYGB_i_bin93]HIK26798.1 chemotaxis protein CheW [Oscillatoriaceae cyanobacterium M7585_C2015_266]
MQAIQEVSYKPYLIFSLDGARYGIEASWVQEIFFLPELTPVAEAPRDIVGIFNLRGRILPVMDLNIRLGQRARDYQLSDSIIVLELQEFQIGIIVNEVHEVQNISSEDIIGEISYGRKIPREYHQLISGVAKTPDGIVMLLDLKQLIHFSPVVELTNEEENSELAEYRVFCPNATPEERAIFRSRAENLMLPSTRQDFTGLIPLAVVGLNGEYFGIDLEIVREFTDIRKITPIPCTPPHIVGNMNLRGEILTLIDLRGVLNLPPNSIEATSKAMVLQVDDIVAGVVVDHVYDVTYLNPKEITPIPTAVHSSNDEFLRGTAPYRDKMMTLLDIPKIFAKGDLVVNEEV